MTAIEPRIVAIFQAIEQRTGVAFEKLVAPGQHHREAHARALAAFLVRQAGWEWADIASLLNRTHMTTIWRAGRVLKEAKYEADLAAIRETLAHREAAS